MKFGALRRCLDQLQRGSSTWCTFIRRFWRTTPACALPRAGHPVIATYHTFFEEYLHHYVPMLPRRIGRALARRFTRSQCAQLDAIVAPSEPMRALLLAYGVRPAHRGHSDRIARGSLPAGRWRAIPRRVRHRRRSAAAVVRRARGAREEHRVPAAGLRRAARVAAPA